jgi:hypothetical protein
MRLVRVHRTQAVWEVWAIADEQGRCLVDDLVAIHESDAEAAEMLAILEREVPADGPPVFNKTRCRWLDKGSRVYEFKTWGWRVSWFYDDGAPKFRRRILCVRLFPKGPQKTLEQEKRSAANARSLYLSSKRAGDLEYLPFRGAKE